MMAVYEKRNGASRDDLRDVDFEKSLDSVLSDLFDAKSKLTLKLDFD